MPGWPPGYPSRGAWLFRDIKEDFAFSPILTSIEITQEFPDMVATFSCEVVHVAGQTFSVEDEVRVLFGGERIFAGHLKTVEETAASEFGPRVWRLEAQDFTAKLGDALIRQRKQRKKESAIRRVRWIVGYLAHAWHIDGHEYDVPNEDLEREDMYGMTVAEALDSVINETGMRPAWIDLDNKLWVVNAAHTIPAPFALDNDAPDYSTSFPFSEFTYLRDGMERANAILVEPEKREDSAWSVAPSNINDFEWGDSTGRKELFVSAEEIRTKRAAERHGDAVLQRRKVPETEAKLVCWEPGIWAGMSVSLTEAQWDHDQTMRVIRVDISAVDPKDDAGEAYLRSELTLNNKPKRRSPKAGRTGPGAASGGGTPVDTSRRVLDRFDRDVAPSTPTEGDSIAVSWVYAELAYGQYQGTSPWFTPGGPKDPVLTYRPSPRGVIAESGYYNHAWPSVPCGVGLGAWSGWGETEQWARLDLPAAPGGAVGVYVTVSVPGYGGAGNAAEVRTKSSAPTVAHDGSLAGRIEGAGSLTVFSDFVGPGSLWVGICAGWQPDYSIYGQGWACVTNPKRPQYTGERNSGTIQAGISFGTRKWAMTSPPPDLGQTESPGGRGPWTWQQAGIEGTPTWGMADGSLYVEDGGVILTLQGEGDDDDEPYGIWAEVKAGVELDFIPSDLTGGAIELTMVGQGSRATVTLDIAAGTVSVAGPSSTDSGDVDLTAGVLHTLVIDTRAGEVRAKVWPSAEVEPAAWDAIAALDETEDDGDSLIVRVVAASGQTIEVPEMRTMAAGDVGQQVVNEWIGAADGLSDSFRSRHPIREGTLTVKVECNDVPPLIEDGSTFRLDYLPTEGSAISLDYVIEGIETEETEEEEGS